MALDRMGLKMIAPHLKGRHVLCLGYPDITIKAEALQAEFGVKAEKFTDHGQAHGAGYPLPETTHLLVDLFGASSVDYVDAMPSRGVERAVDLNTRWVQWPQEAGVIINPGTAEHCFDVAAAMFNAWRALAVGGFILHISPMTMMNHGFWNFSPTVFADFAAANGGSVRDYRARDKDWWEVGVDLANRFKAPAEVVMYCLMTKESSVPDTIPTQGRFK